MMAWAMSPTIMSEKSGPNFPCVETPSVNGTTTFVINAGAIGTAIAISK